MDILLIAFTRPDLLERAVESLCEVRLRRGFLALDGPRPDHPEDRKLIDACEQVVQDVLGHTAPIEILRWTQNLGMKRACVGAIDWFFTQTDEGVILEVDCVIDPTFLPFAGKLFDRYRSDKRVMGICGEEFVGAPPPPLGASSGFVRNYRRASGPQVRRVALGGRADLQGPARRPDEPLRGRVAAALCPSGP